MVWTIAPLMRSALKRAAMWSFNHGLIKGEAVLRLFALFDLWSA